ncbi:MAG TPA: flagellar hook-basal body complex protein [Candidatus Limnocylindria bacterium]|nr:flagellar hook-basal body complex protein [Candidatus Limnocylindria bacterium]
MLSTLNTAVSGLNYFQNQLEVIGNDVANSNTTGFKSGKVEAVDNFNKYFSPGSSTASSIQIGSGVSTSSVSTDFQNGTIADTGYATDMAVDGNGYFTVQDPNSKINYVTRDGHFSVDTDHYLVNSSGYRVQGYKDGTLATVGDIQIDGAGFGGQMQGYSIGGDGKITIIDGTGTPQTRGQVLLQTFSNQSALVKQGGNMYANTAAAGASTAAPPSTAGNGKLRVKALEQSNVDLAGELTSLITMQRGYQANARIVTTTDDILQEVVNLKR